MCLVFSLIIVFLSFFSTYVFQAGLVGLLVSRYKVPIIISVLYLGLSIAYHVVSLNTRWYEPQSFWWTDQLLALFILHRSGEGKHLCEWHQKLDRVWLLSFEWTEQQISILNSPMIDI